MNRMRGVNADGRVRGGKPESMGCHAEQYMEPLPREKLHFFLFAPHGTGWLFRGPLDGPDHW